MFDAELLASSAAMRFFRTCVGLKDDFYNRYIVKNDCFLTVMEQLQANCHRDNLVRALSQF